MATLLNIAPRPSLAHLRMFATHEFHDCFYLCEEKPVPTVRDYSLGRPWGIDYGSASQPKFFAHIVVDRHGNGFSVMISASGNTSIFSGLDRQLEAEEFAVLATVGHDRFAEIGQLDIADLRRWREIADELSIPLTPENRDKLRVAIELSK